MKKKIPHLFGRLNAFIGNTLKFILPHKWLRAEKPFYKVNNEYIVYGLGGYAFGALERLGNRFLFPGLKEIKRVPGGILETPFEKEQASTRDNIYTELSGTATFEIINRKGALTYYENDADLETAKEIVLKHATSHIGNYEENGLEAKIPEIEARIIRDFEEETKKKRDLEKYGLKITGLALSTSFSPESNIQRKGYRILQAQNKEIDARGDYSATIVHAEATRESAKTYLETAKNYKEVGSTAQTGDIALELAGRDNDEIIATKKNIKVSVPRAPYAQPSQKTNLLIPFNPKLAEGLEKILNRFGDFSGNPSYSY